MSKEKMDKELGMKGKALKERTGKHTMHKTHHSQEYCRHCGKPTTKSVRHESGHSEYACVDAPKTEGVSIKR